MSSFAAPSLMLPARSPGTRTTAVTSTIRALPAWPGPGTPWRSYRLRNAQAVLAGVPQRPGQPRCRKLDEGAYLGREQAALRPDEMHRHGGRRERLEHG